jgi:hypothetical protein
LSSGTKATPQSAQTPMPSTYSVRHLGQNILSSLRRVLLCSGHNNSYTGQYFLTSYSFIRGMAITTCLTKWTISLPASAKRKSMTKRNMRYSVDSPIFRVL